MKNKLKYILLVVGVAVIIFGALIPTMFKKASKDTFTYERDSTAGYYYCYVYVESEEDYEITDAVITLVDVFNEHNKLTKSPQSLSATNSFRTKEGNKYVYQITINLTQTEYFDYTKVESVSLTTSIGTRSVEEEKFSFGINWRIPVMIFVIVIGCATTIVGICLFVTERSRKKYAEQVRKELAKTNPEINTAEMTDEEVLAKKSELKRKEFQEEGGLLAGLKEDLTSFLGVESKTKEKVCEYCGSTNSADARKCSSCGASLKSKK